ncbi:MAG: helix-turn-helix transcriptional regulator [Labilithrix sp.]|nr:helix-turn-helix transcriptional regulator [Labilithrix sp.]
MRRPPSPDDPAKARGAAERRGRSKERRAALRDELYERIARGDISIADAVKTMRKIAGRSQADYARLVGVSPRILIELERGIGNPTLKTLAKLLAPFDLEVGLRRRPKEPRAPRP